MSWQRKVATRALATKSAIPIPLITGSRDQPRNGVVSQKKEECDGNLDVENSIRGVRRSPSINERRTDDVDLILGRR